MDKLTKTKAVVTEYYKGVAPAKLCYDYIVADRDYEIECTITSSQNENYCEIEGVGLDDHMDGRYVLPTVEKGIKYIGLYINSFGHNPEIVIPTNHTYVLRVSIKDPPTNGTARLILPNGMGLYRVKHKLGVYTEEYSIVNQKGLFKDNEELLFCGETYKVTEVDSDRLTAENGVELDRTRVYNPETGEIEPANVSTMGGE